ncbi:MAG: AzlD domain-containing protein [Rhodospirillaceae bacterium]|nr:AzlD domain-containing protein [Rhodospirillaceae bacterium]
MDEPFAWLTIAVAAVVTYMWRGLGVALAGRVAPDSKVLEWVTCVAYALLAGLVARMILVPVGPLAEVALWMRLAAIAACVGCYLAFGRRLLPGVLAGAVTLAGLAAIFGL